MNIFDILGPVMVGPSSSHTAGAVRIGLIARELLGEEPVQAHLFLHGSFAATGAGHGTDRALIAGLLGLTPDDPRIPDSFSLARERGLAFTIVPKELRGAHPNTAELELSARSGKQTRVRAASVGGGRIVVDHLDGVKVSFSGESNTLIVHSLDRPGLAAEITSLLAFCQVNIGTLQLFRDRRGGTAVMVAEIDTALPPEAMRMVERLDGIRRATYLMGAASRLAQ